MRKDNGQRGQLYFYRQSGNTSYPCFARLCELLHLPGLASFIPFFPECQFMDIQEYWSILKRRWITSSLVFLSVSVLSLGTLMIQKQIYQSDGKIRFTRGDRATALIGVGKEMGQFEPLLETNNPISTEIEVIRSAPIIQATINTLDLKDQKGKTLTRTRFLRNLTLTNNRGTDILQVSYKDNSPERAKSVVDALMKIYVDNHLRENRAEAVAARKFIEQQLPAAEASVQKASRALRRFKEQNQIAALDEENQAAVTANEELRRRLSELRSDLSNTNAQVIEFRDQLEMIPKEGITMASLSQSPGVQEALKQLQDVESQIAIKSSRYQDESPVMQQLQEKRANLVVVLDQRISQILNGQKVPSRLNLQIGETREALVGDFVRSEIRQKGLAEQVWALSKAQEAYQQRINAVPRLEQEHRELTRQLEAAQTTYSLLLQKFHEARVAENRNVGNARIIQTATNLEKPVSPRPSVHLLTGTMLGILLAISTALTLEFRDQSVRTVRAVRELFGYPLLGVIPSFKRTARNATPEGMPPALSEVIVRDHPLSPLSETYRIVQANLKFLSSDQSLKTIVVSSSVAGEGKSVVSANLAMAMAQMGNRVLLIDADLRSPSQHTLWHVPNEIGLSSAILEQLEAQCLIREVAPNLDLLVAGKLPMHPAALLDSQQMTSSIQQLATHYNFVIIDTAPISSAADAQILGKIADGLLLVIRPGIVDMVNATLTRERLEQSDQNVLGLVINGVCPEHEPHSYYYYSFNHGYGNKEGSPSYGTSASHTPT